MINNHKKNILIFIPTYNEVNNVENILKKIINLKIDTDILFIDDNSPDGTGELLDKLSNVFSRVFVQHRIGKLGIGSAHREAILWAYKNRYNAILTLDCDATHPPEYIPSFIKRLDEFDLVVGTRHLNKSSLADWSIKRKFLTKLGYLLTYYLLNIPYDATGAYRIYNLDLINSKFLDTTRSNGYSFLFETIFILNFNNYKIGEIPIHLPSRENDCSKMSYRDICQSLLMLFKIFFEKIFSPKKFIIKE